MSDNPSLQDLLEVQAHFGLPSLALVEKDWHVVRALAGIAAVDAAPLRLVFGGGTVLSRAHRLIRRMSEDVDLKIVADERPHGERAADDPLRGGERILDRLDGGRRADAADEDRDRQGVPSFRAHRRMSAQAHRRLRVVVVVVVVGEREIAAPREAGQPAAEARLGGRQVAGDHAHERARLP